MLRVTKDRWLWVWAGWGLLLLVAAAWAELARPALVLAALSGAGGVLVGLRRLLPESLPGRRPLLVGGLLALGAVGEIGWAVAATGRLAVSSTTADLLLLTGYLLAMLAAAALVRLRTGKGDAIEAAIVLAALLGVLWDRLTGPALRAEPTAEELARLAPMPLLLVAAGAVLLHLLLCRGGPTVSGGALLVAVAAATGAALLTAVDGGSSPLPPGTAALWTLGYLAAGLAGLHRGLGELLRPSAERAFSPPRGRLVVVGLALLAAQLTALTAVAARSDRAESVVSVAATALPGAALVALSAYVPASALAAVLGVGLLTWRVSLLLTERERTSHEGQRRAERESALTTLSTGVLSGESVPALLERTGQLLGDTLGDDGVSLRLVDPRLAPSGPAAAGRLQATDAASVVSVALPSRPLDQGERDFVLLARDLVAGAVLRRAAEAKANHQALHDTLTGLPNRLLFLDRLEHSIAGSGRDHGACVVLFVNLDDFAGVNQEYGHAGGDQILVVTARRLTSVLRPGDTVSRFSGDEFAVLCENASASAGLRIAERLMSLFADPVRLPPGAIPGGAHRATTARVSASIGVAVAREGDDPELVLRRAGDAMNEAKDSGKGRVILSFGLAGESP